MKDLKSLQWHVTGANQAGLALLLSLVYLLVIAIIGLVIVVSASLQFRMAGNHESRLVAEQDARAVAHELTAAVDHTLQLPPTHTACGTDDFAAGCDQSTLTPPSLLHMLGRDNARYGIQRRHPRILQSAVGRESQARASSAAHDRFALYEVAVSVNAEPGRPGNAHIVRGVAVRLPSDPQQ
jgi:hypothetical protein